jgi:Predicted membrane protein
VFVIFAAILLVVFVFLGLIGAAFGRIGFSAQAIALLLIAVLVGSFINVPLLTLESQSRVLQNTYVSIFGMTYRVPSAAEGSRKTVVAVNVGALIPSIVSLYLLWQFPDIAGVAIVGVTLVAIVSHLTSRPVAGVGIVSPALVSPLVAAIYTIFVLTQVPAIENGFALAYISGVLGTLIGADITNLNAIKKIGAPVTSIGGAGTFDGVFLSGIIAVLLT